METASIEKLCRFDVETTLKNPCGKLIDISSIVKVESTSKFARRIDVIISTWIRLSKPMKPTNFPRGISTSNRWRIDEDVSVGMLLQATLHEIDILICDK